jgi:hypothetical protein
VIIKKDGKYFGGWDNKWNVRWGGRKYAQTFHKNVVHRVATWFEGTVEYE